jgi:hypothetical protein
MGRSTKVGEVAELATTVDEFDIEKRGSLFTISRFVESSIGV